MPLTSAPLPPRADYDTDMTPWLWSISEMGEQSKICGRDIFEALESSPQRSGAGFAIPLTSQEAPKGSCHADGFPEGWLLIGRRNGFVDEYIQGLPFGLFKENRAGSLRNLTAELYQNDRSAKPRPYQQPGRLPGFLLFPTAGLQFDIHS